MTQLNRLPAPHGAWINREAPLSFVFDGRQYEGYAGDTIASALAANGVWLLSRSFKYHRPRGILTMAGQDANTLVQLPDEPNVAADRELLRADLQVSGQNYNGSLTHDRDMRVQYFSKFLPVGFYYKAFYKPRGAWERFWEPYFRKKAGLGKVNEAAAEQYFDKRYEFCQVAVIGAGAAGLSAAAAAAEAGADVILIDENAQPGGALNYARFDGEGAAAVALRRHLIAAVEKAGAKIRVFANAVCNGWFADHYLPVIRGNRLHKIRAEHCIIAGGSIEQPLVFRNNDLPGIMQGSAAQRLIKQYGVKPGQRAVVVTANCDGYGVCLDLLDAGVEVAAVVDLRNTAPAHPLADAVCARGITPWYGHTVYEALATSGHRHVAAAVLRPINGRGSCGPGGATVECDLICMSPGYMPAWQLPCHAGAQLGYDEKRAAFTIGNVPAGCAIAGSLNNTVTFADACQDGYVAAAALGYQTALKPPQTGEVESVVNADWHIFPHPKGKEFVDFDEDLQIADISNAAADGYDHVQLLKRYSTAGMGPSQGRHAALAVARLLSWATGQSLAEAGVTTARPPFTGEKLGVMGGRQFSPARHTAMHHQHKALGAQLMPAGLWLRPAYYGRRSERQHCVRREVLAVRNAVGIIDVSTLGGLEISGAEAAEFLNRMYTGAFIKQMTGRCRYVVMCNEQGVVIDDGIACRLHERHYYVTATTAGVDNVYRNMLKWNAQWRLDVDISNVSAAWAAVNIAGTDARKVLQQAGCDIDLSLEAFPYMAVKTATVAGIAARLMRVGFVGELGYEIHVPATMGAALWDALMQAGQAFNLQPFGVEAQRLLRLEKGHIIIGQDTDSLSFPQEVNLKWAVAATKPFFVGGRFIESIDRRPLQRRLVGFTLPKDSPQPKESHLVIDREEMAGRVTSCEFSPTLDKIIGMAYVPPQQAEPGNTLYIRTDDGTLAAATVVALPFYDPAGERQKVTA